MADEHNDADKQIGGIVPIVNQTGLPNTFKGKAQQFILRWLAGGIGHPYVRQIRENLDELDGRSRVNMMLAEEVGRQAIADPALIDRAKARFLGNFYRKQENVEAVAQAAEAKINAEADAETTSEPSEDWMNAFTAAAEGASSEQLRDRLAAVLAGEIKKPGSISRATIRLVAEIETNDLLDFTRILTNRYGDNIYAPTEWGSGEMVLIGKNLAALGMIGTELSNNIKVGDNGNGFLFGSSNALILQGDISLQRSIQIWTLTRLGKEISSLLPATEEKVALRAVANDLPKEGLKTVLLGHFTRQEGTDQVNVIYGEVLWAAPPVSVTIPMPSGVSPFSQH